MTDGFWCEGHSKRLALAVCFKVVTREADAKNEWCLVLRVPLSEPVFLEREEIA